MQKCRPERSPKIRPEGGTTGEEAARQFQAHERGAHHISVWWEPMVHVHYRVEVRYADGVTPPAGVGPLPEHGWDIASHEANNGYGSGGMEIGGEENGFFPGARLQVRLIGMDNDRRPTQPSGWVDVTTWHATELGPVKELEAEKQGPHNRVVIIKFRAADGQDAPIGFSPTTT